MTSVARRKRLIPYSEQRVLEDVAHAHGFVPTRIFAIMLPVWCVEVRATTTDGRPYEVIDQFLERAIAEAQVSTVADLSRFLSLERPLVDRAIRVLATIGHVTFRGDTIELTDLGRASLRDDVCYLVTVQDRRKMYFDAYRSWPLSRKYYDPTTVTLLPLEEVNSAKGNAGPSFHLLHSTHGFRKEALAELAANPKRDDYNLPARIENPESLGEELVYLPVYVVRATDAGRLTYLVYSQAADTADSDLTELVGRSPEITASLDAEYHAADPEDQKKRITRWLERHSMAHCRPVRTAQGTWRVVLPENAFAPSGTVGLSKVASYAVLDQDILHVSCEARGVRERALLERVDAYLTARRSRTSPDVRAHLARVATQLGLASVGLPELQRMAAAAGKTGMASELAKIAEDE
ncbi:hypothetical protein ALI144C_48650 [Actinosynnema sp. ALI-1.44]|uniref:hypothetical protein n=1 Tax=Actinosynnema sp. ALI-1.44 TaxID=1933779 RepID=UPI00097C9D42|nr:hypothetical protein [Actinosynnema sp. ALI-1.44]ONI70517.1 hypothetical protein ALI144C_48650 [Actinosynnema sp. ALI-1.44]